jgi:hypothetical protein
LIFEWEVGMPIRFALGSMVALICGVSMAATDSGTLKPEVSHEAGFTQVWTQDESRVWPRSKNLDRNEGPLFRPVRIDVWLPAKCRQKGMTLADDVVFESPGPAFIA